DKLVTGVQTCALPICDPFLVFGAEKHGFEGTSIYPSFNGWMDEIRVWSVARSAAEIEAARGQAVAPTTPGLALYLRLEEGSGTEIGRASCRERGLRTR